MTDLPGSRPLKEFARRVLDRHDVGDVDGGAIQDWGLELGLLVKVQVTEPCGEECSCAEWDDFPQECIRLAPELTNPETR
mgnify:CR=1 FL=1